jgi:3-isopropylmalate dehydratase small subunit
LASREVAPRLALLAFGVVAMVVAPSFVSLHYEDLLVQGFI